MPCFSCPGRSRGTSAGSRPHLRAARLHARRRVLSGPYRRLWYGQAVSAVGDKVFATTLILWVSQEIAGGRPWAPAAVSGLLIAAGAAALVGPAAGVFIDRWDRITVMTLTEAVRAVLAAALAALAFVPVRELPPWLWLCAVYGTVFLLAACGQFFALAQLAVTGELVRGPAEQARAIAAAEVTTSASSMLGPPIAAPLMFAIGPQWALAANAVSYVASCLITRSLRPVSARPRRPAGAAANRPASWRSEFRAGLRIFAGNRYVSALLTVTVICQAGAAAITTLNVFFVTSDLHAPPSAYGIAEMAMGSGFVVGALTAGLLVRRAGPRRVTFCGLFAAGILTVGYALQRDAGAGLAVLALYAAMIAVLNTAAGPLLLAAAPRDYLGRVLAVFSPVNQLVSSLSVVAWGWLASTALRTFRASAAGLTVNAVSLIFILAGCLIIAAGVRALIALPPSPGRENPPARTGPGTRSQSRRGHDAGDSPGASCISTD